jgi:hypothetical protein
VSARACIALAGAVVAASASAAPPRWENVTAGGALRPGVYGQIEVRGAPPPLVQDKPTMVERPTADARRDPIYLYLPPGQVRRWAQHCARWNACDRPVYFVRMDDSPSRLGAWKKSAQREAAPSAMLHALNRFTQ